MWGGGWGGGGVCLLTCLIACLFACCVCVCFCCFSFCVLFLLFFWRGSIYIDDREVDEKGLAGGRGGLMWEREGAEGRVQGAGEGG